MNKLQHRFKHPVSQVSFSSCYDKNAPEKYWSHIEDIAELIAHRLCGIDSSSHRHAYLSMSTISVAQHKEKFGQARVYCTLADSNLVAKRWLERGNSTAPPDEYVRERVLSDAKRYRETYRMIFDLCPHYYNATRYGADYPALLCETQKELEELLDSEFYTGWDRNDREALLLICDFVNEGQKS